jgi:hypothetical protein
MLSVSGDGNSRWFLTAVLECSESTLRDATGESTSGR